MSATDKTPPMWRSREERLGTADAQAHLFDEFPGLAARVEAGLDRRSALKFMGAAMALGGVSACAQPAEEILPYVNQPEGLVPGNPRFYATTLLCEGYGIGALVESHEGRPTKIEGNPDHPASLGATDAVMQAACLDLFDPARSRVPLHNGQPTSMANVDLMLADLNARLDAAGGRRVAILAGPTTSPSTKALVATLGRQFPGLGFYRHEPLGNGSIDLCGGRLLLRPRLTNAQVILSMDADFLGDGPGKLAHARDFAARRRVVDSTPPGGMTNRLYAVESTPTITGASADHRFALRLSEMGAVLRALGAHLAGQDMPQASIPAATLKLIGDDLRQAGLEALVLPGPHLPTELQRLVVAINQTLGAMGHTLEALPHRAFAPDVQGDMADLVDAIEAGAVDVLLILETNPVYTAPGDLDMERALARVGLKVHLGTHEDETAAMCDWHIPAVHPLETWGDARAFDGTASLIQPLIRPLYDGRTPAQVLTAAAGVSGPNAHDFVMAHWADQGLSPDDWRRALKKGVLDATAVAPVDPQCGTLAAALAALPAEAPVADLELRFVPDPFLRDGRYATNVWLQELPRPLTKIVWGNVAAMAPATARALGVESGTVVDLSVNGASIALPAWVQPGHSQGSVTLTLGYGRAKAGEMASAIGTDVFPLRSQAALWTRAGAKVTPRAARVEVITTQHHQAMEGRDPVRHATLAAYRENPDLLHENHPAPPEESLYPEWDYKEEAWGMIIDQSVCIGCNACVAACQAENNIPTVGPEECRRGHEMHWLRIDRYYAGPEDDPDTYFQPVPCMHCEKAPCEVVCPVNATVHTHDGLNAQVYNRCIGTRYCSQNCPYKVRRFNFHRYQPFDAGASAPTAPIMNPDVSVRSRGVMEKCTYCVQRISAARIEADIDGRAIHDGAVVTACQQACPTEAIRFGDLNDSGSVVRRLRDDPLNYALLEHLNTRPRTTYLGHISNPHPAIRANEALGDGDSDD